MKNTILFLVFIFCLVFTSLIKNNTRSVEKKLLNIRKDILQLNFQLNDAKLELEYLKTPQNLKNLSKTFFDDDFSYYKVSNIETLILNKISKINEK